MLQHLKTPLVPFCTATGLQFGAGDSSSAGGAEGGAWRNYFVGVVGAVGAVEEEVLWPNQVSLKSYLGSIAAVHSGERFRGRDKFS